MGVRQKMSLLRVWALETMRSRFFRRSCWIAFFYLAVALIIVSDFIGGLVLKEGQISPFDIKAPRSLVFIDEQETERLRKEAAARVEKVYQEDTNVAPALEKKIQEIFTGIRQIKSKDLVEEEKLEKLRAHLSTTTGATVEETAPLPKESLKSLLEVSEEELILAEETAKKLLLEELHYGLKEEALLNAQENLARGIELSEIDRSYSSVLTFILQETIRPNLVFEQETYEKRVLNARAQVTLVQRTIQAGQIIVREGDPIESVDLEVLRQLGLLKHKNTWPALIGVCFFVVLLGGLFFLYLRHFRRDFLKQDKLLILLGLLFTLTLLIAKGITVLKISNQPEVADLIGFMVPLSAGAMLITILLDAGLAVFSAVVLSVLLGIMTDSQLSFVIVGLIGSLIGIYGVSSLSNRTGLIKNGFYIALTNMTVIIIIGLLNATRASIVVVGAGMGMINGFLSSVLTLGSLPYLEAAFGITTSVHLLELSNPNQPLLKRLLMEAPGTYHHSILVGNLAEAAAEVVGADPLIVRIGAYYHDVGKLKRPYFFIENQMGGENPHNKLSPSLSTLIVTSHVKDGLELAREYNLPQIVQDIIEQHHGTTLVLFFYQRALESERPELVTEASYRYDCPKPQSKEAALVMLADGVEAAVRSLQKPTPGRLEGLTRKIIKERLHDGQLEECDLTFKDLNKIAEVFVRVLSGIFHSRIEYPENVLSEIERRKNKGAVINQ